MCTWALGIAAAGAAASLGGTLYSASQSAGFAADQNKAQQEKQAASAAARAAEVERQKKFDEASRAQWQAELQDQAPTKFKELAETGTQEALDTTQRVTTESNINQGLLPGQTGSSVSDVFTKDAARATAEKMSDADKRIKALARLSGFDRAQGYQSTSAKQFSADQSLLADQARKSLQLGQQEGNITAPFVGSPNTALGAGASAIGNVALQYGGSKGAWNDISNIFSSYGGGGGFNTTPGTSPGYGNTLFEYGGVF